MASTSMSGSERNRRRQRVGGKLGRYSTVAGAALAGLHAADAEAGVRYAGPFALEATAGSPIHIDFDLDGNDDLRLSVRQLGSTSVSSVSSTTDTGYTAGGATVTITYVYNYGYFYGTNDAKARALQNHRIAFDGDPYVARLPAGAIVGPARFLGGDAGQDGWLASIYGYGFDSGTSTFVNGVLQDGANFHPSITSTYGSYGYFVGERGFMGVELDLAGQTHYAWVDVEVSDLAESITVHGWAWEVSPDEPIETGAIPEPTSLALLAMGAAGVMAHRRRRRSEPRRAD